MDNSFLMILGFLNLGGGEVFVILVVVLLLFGSKKIPELAQGLGKGMRQFKDAMNGVQSELQNEMKGIEKTTNVDAGGINDLKDTVSAVKEIHGDIKKVGDNLLK